MGRVDMASLWVSAQSSLLPTLRREARNTRMIKKKITCFVCHHEIAEDDYNLGYAPDGRAAHEVCLIAVWYTGRPPGEGQGQPDA